MRRELLRSMTLPTIVDSCPDLKDINYIYTGENKEIEKDILVKHQVFQPVGEYDEYDPLNLQLNPRP